MAQSDTSRPSKIYRGTVDDVFSDRNEIPPDATLELKVFKPEAEDNFAGKSLADVLQEIGTVKGLPADLSTNPKYMQGFGETRTPGKM